MQGLQIFTGLGQVLLELCGFFVVLLLLRAWLTQLPDRVASILFGICVGFGCILTMSQPLAIGDGVIADTRGALITVASLFGGPLVGLIVATMASAFRLYLGGAGMYAGLIGNLAALLIGLGLNAYTLGRNNPIRAQHIGIAMIALMVSLSLAFAVLPSAVALSTYLKYGPTVALINGIGVVILGGLLLLDDRRRAMHRRLMMAEAEARAAALAKGRFLALMSHEIRTPMTAILGMARLLAEEPLQARQMDYVRAMRAAGEGMMLLLSDVLDLTRLESGRLTVENRPFNLMEILADLRSLYQPQAQAKGLQFRTDLPDRERLWLKGDGTRIRQVLSNFLNNALKFTTSGTITLGCHLSDAGPEMVALRFTVRDTGHGIAPEKLPTLFTPFLQADPSVERQSSGLGLAISRDLAKVMGGEIGASSIVGVGSEFYLTLALAVSAPVVQPHSEPVGSGGLRILLAEDVPANQMLIREVLTRSGHQVDIVGDGRAAVEAVRRNGPYDLVLMDSHMPEMDGIDAIRALHHMGNPPPVIAMTADSSPQSRQALEAAGALSILSKPVPWSDLLAAIAHFTPAPRSVGS